MFCFKRRENTSERKDFCVYILPNQEKIFGKLGDIKLEGDATISRKHATVSVQLTDESDTQYKCVINDTSKYGTYIMRNNEKKQLLPNENFLLKADDIVQFGLKDTTFVVSFHMFVTAKSSLDVQNVEKLKNVIHLIKGRISENWENSCTHLTVDKTVPVTAKITCALATLKPIVTIEYWEAVNIAIKEFKELPKIEDFLPTIKEELLNASSNLLLSNEKRRTLFKGLSFVHFCVKQYYAYASVIIAAGGKSCVYPTKRPLTPRDLTAKNAIVIQQPVSDSSETQIIPPDYRVIYRKLQDIKRRMISETEIPLAILHCSTEIYCNPLFKFGTLLKSKPHVIATNVMVEDTQDVVKTDTRQVKRKIIPETYDSQDIQHLPTRVRFSDESEQRNIPRASTSGNVTEDTQNAVKRNIGCKIIPETCSSLNSDKVSNESEQNISCASAKDTSMIVSENTVRKDNRCKIIIPETCNSPNIESVSKNSSSYESEQRNISRFSKSGIATEIGQKNKKRDFEYKIIPETCTSSNTESISKKSQLLNENEQTNVVNVSSDKVSRKLQVISDEACRPPNVVINMFSSNSTRKNNNKQPLMIFDKNDIVNKPAEKKQTISLHQRNTPKENILTPSTNTQQVENLFRENEFNLQQRENILMNEEDNVIFENVNLSSPKENNLIIEKTIGNDKHKNTSQEKFKNSANKQIITIDETDDICMEQRKENNVPGKRATHQEPKKLLKERQLDSASNLDNNRENNRAKENETEERNKSRNTCLEGNRHKRYLNQERTDKLFRKDGPNGKRFKKAPVIIPTRRLKEDDFY
ncbi:nibrin [Pseudomyrmex gracilis]|uniref:nibrin n=1 Tax=Pseudomyrmex gracilis TaxID=219809 RepID=UPI000994969A|nr:nibrin [Pseudomyrmex gracilis]